MIAITAGFSLGLTIKLIITKRLRERQYDKQNSEVVVIVECVEEQMEMIKGILWSHNAFGVRSLDIH